MSIDQATVDQFNAMVHKEAAQIVPRLRPYVETKQITGENWYYDSIGNVEVRKNNARFSKVEFDEVQFSRRKLVRDRFSVFLPIDAKDTRNLLLDPDSLFAKRAVEAALRQMDRVLFEAALADVYVGRDFTETLTAAEDGVVTVNATAGLTYSKLLEINENFMNNDVGIDDNEEMYLVHTGREHTQLMKEQELTSGDYSRSYNVEGGRIKNAAGFQLVPFAANAVNPIIPVKSSQRQLFAASKRGILLGIGKDIEVKIKERDDLVETTQVQLIMEIGAVRTEGKLIQQVNVTA